MVAATHQSFGLTWGLSTFFILQTFGINPGNLFETILFFILVLLGSIFPDIDKLRSRIGRRLWFVSVFIRILFGHRGFTHSLLFVGVMCIGSYLITAMLEVTPAFAAAWTAGILSHMIGDFLTPGGVPLFYPWKKRFASPLTFRTGSATEKFLNLGLLCLNLYIIYRLFL